MPHSEDKISFSVLASAAHRLKFPFLSALSTHFLKIENSCHAPQTRPEKSLVLTIQSNRRGQCYHSLLHQPARCLDEEKRRVTQATLFIYTRSGSESQFYCLFCFTGWVSSPQTMLALSSLLGLPPRYALPSLVRKRPSPLWSQEIQAQLYEDASAIVFAFYRMDGERNLPVLTMWEKHSIVNMLSSVRPQHFLYP